MTHAPKGGCYVADHLAGQEKFYEGGQFLPESTPPLKKKAKKVAKKLNSITHFKCGDIVLRPTPVIDHYEVAVEQLNLQTDQLFGYQRLEFGDDRSQLLLNAIAIATEMDANLKLI